MVKKDSKREVVPEQGATEETVSAEEARLKQQGIKFSSQANAKRMGTGPIPDNSPLRFLMAGK